jgi:hypothetical protein
LSKKVNNKPIAAGHACVNERRASNCGPIGSIGSGGKKGTMPCSRQLMLPVLTDFVVLPPHVLDEWLWLLEDHLHKTCLRSFIVKIRLLKLKKFVTVRIRGATHFLNDFYSASQQSKCVAPV